MRLPIKPVSTVEYTDIDFTNGISLQSLYDLALSKNLNPKEVKVAWSVWGCCDECYPDGELFLRYAKTTPPPPKEEMDKYYKALKEYKEHTKASLIKKIEELDKDLLDLNNEQSNSTAT